MHLSHIRLPHLYLSCSCMLDFRINNNDESVISVWGVTQVVELFLTMASHTHESD